MSVLITWGPVSDTIRSVHITEAKVLLLEVSTTILSPSIWYNDVSTHDWGQVSTARGQLYYIESQYLTQLGHYTFSINSLSPSNWHLDLVHIPEAKYILIQVSTTILSPSIWH